MPTIKFPYNVISGAAGEYAKLYNSYLEPPLEFFYMSYLTCLGSAVADKITIASELKPQPRLYTLLLGESADDRKSTAIKYTIAFFKNYINACKGVGSGEGLMKQMKKNPNTLLYFDEFKQFVSKSTISSSVLLPYVATLFEDNEVENVIKTSEVEIKNGYLTMLAASTIETYERTWESSFTDIGFNNRLFLVPGSGIKQSFLPEKIPDSVKQRLLEELGSLIGRVSNKFEYEIADDVRKKMQTWYLAMSPSEHNKRLDGYAHRLMCLLALNEKRDIIDMDIANKVIKLIDWQFIVRQMYDPIDADNATAKMEVRIRRQLINGNELTERELKRNCHSERSGLYIFNNALTNLRGAKEIERTKDGLYRLVLTLGEK